MMMMMLFLFVCAWPSCKSATLTSSFELRKSWLPFVGRVCRWMAARFFKDFRHSNRMKRKTFSSARDHHRRDRVRDFLTNFDRPTRVRRHNHECLQSSAEGSSSWVIDLFQILLNLIIFHFWLNACPLLGLSMIINFFDSPVSLTTHTSTRDLQT